MERSGYRIKESGKGSWVWFLVIALAIALVGGFLIFDSLYRGGQSGRVGLEFSKPDVVLIGQPFTVGVSLSNPSDNILKEAQLSLTLPEGISFLGQSQDQRLMEQSIGDLGPGSVSQRTFNLIALSGHQTLQRLSTALHYKTPGSSAEFKETANLDLVLGQPAVNLSILAPQEVVSGETFEVKLSYENNSGHDFKNLTLQIDYPSIFKFEKSSEKPDRGNNVWSIGGLARGEKGELTLRGAALGPERTFFGFNAVLTAEFFGQTYTINTQVASLSIAVSPLALYVTVNGKTDYIARPGDSLTYTLTYRNNSETTFENLTARAQFISELFDFVTVQGSGFFNSLTNTFTWTVATVPRLAIVGPGDEGSVELTIKLKDRFPIRRLGDKNFTLKILAQIESPTVPPQTSAQKTVTLASLENKMGGELSIDALGYFRDAESGIVNSGPFPPKVNQPTQYTIHWRVLSRAVDISNLHVSSFLLSGSRWTGVVKGNVESLPIYDPSSGRVTWEILNLPANKGAVGGSTPAEVIFQIEATPAVNQIGREFPLLGETRIQGQDNFTQMILTDSDDGITTALPDDLTLGGVDHKVQP